MYVEPRAYTIPGEGLPVPMSGCAPCAAMRGTGETFADGTEKPAWWDWIPVVSVVTIAGLGVLMWRLAK